MEKDSYFAQKVENKINNRSRLLFCFKCFGLIIFFYIAAVVLFQLGERSRVSQIDDVEQSITQEQTFSLLDSDNDGLKDWQEELYGTSNKLRDTDGDGMTDGDEVLLGRDPDYYGEGLIDQPAIPTEQPFDNTAFDPVSLVATNTQTDDLLQEEDQSESNVSLLRSELNSIGTAIEQNTSSLDTDVELFERLFSRSLEADDVSNIETIIVGLRQVSLDLSLGSFSTDSALETASIDLAYTNTAEALQALLANQDIPDSEYRDLLSRYSFSVTQQQRALIAIHNLVISKGITFGPTEPGRLFLFEFSL